MDKIKFTFDETNEEVTFCILANTQYNDMAYVLVIDDQDVDSDDADVYILKATEVDDIDVYYDIVDDDDEINAVLPALEKQLSDIEID